MNRIAVLICIFAVIPTFCYGQVGSRVALPVSTPLPLPGPASANESDITPGIVPDCLPEDEPRSVMVRDIEIHFYCGITEHQRDVVTGLVRYALESGPPDVALKADVFVLNDLQQAARARFRWLLGHGYPQSYEEIVKEVGSNCGQAEKGALFLYFTKECWYGASDYPNEELILHEMHHLLQFELAGSAGHDFPLWLAEGGADFFAWQQVEALDNSGFRIPPPSTPCKSRLADLADWMHDESDICVYWEGQHAVSWLVRSYGAAKYYDLFRSRGFGRSFSAIFLATYGISLGEFYPVFDQYRKSSYDVIPTVPVSPLIATPLPRP